MSKLAFKVGLFCAASGVIFVACAQQNHEVSVKTGSLTATYSEGQGAIPHDFPLPIYPQATVSGSMSAQDKSDKQDTRMLMLTVSDSVEKVSQYYQEKMKTDGWHIESTSTMGELANILATKEAMQANVIIAPDSPSGKTQITIAVTPKASS